MKTVVGRAGLLRGRTGPVVPLLAIVTFIGGRGPTSSMHSGRPGCGSRLRTLGCGCVSADEHRLNLFCHSKFWQKKTALLGGLVFISVYFPEILTQQKLDP